MASNASNGQFRLPSWIYPYGEDMRQYHIFRDRNLPSLGLLAPDEAETLILARFTKLSRGSRKPIYCKHASGLNATPSIECTISGLEDYRIVIKDESKHRTGTHKDRMAWKVFLHHAHLLEEKAQGNILLVPRFSIISAGSAAMALAATFSDFLASPPKILCNEDVYCRLTSLSLPSWFDVFKTDLEERPLSSNDVLRLTQNPRGIDLTDGSFAPHVSGNYYDSLSYEIFNLKPDVVIVPYGTGELFHNLLHHLRRETDSRFTGERGKLSQTSIIGVTVPNGSRAYKLAAKYLGGLTKEKHIEKVEHEISEAISSGHCGELSRIAQVEDFQLGYGKAMMDGLNIDSELSGAAGLAWLLFNKNNIPENFRIVIVNTGKSCLEV